MYTVVVLSTSVNILYFRINNESKSKGKLVKQNENTDKIYYFSYFFCTRIKQMKMDANFV